jgi:hypothetical protein
MRCLLGILGRNLRKKAKMSSPSNVKQTSGYQDNLTNAENIAVIRYEL